MAIKKMNNGKYKVNVYMGASFSRFVAYADTKEEAMILEQEAKLQKLKGEFKKKKGDYTFKEVYEMWWKKKYIITKHHEQSTLDRTKSVFRLHILPFLGDKKIKHVSFDILENLQILWAFGDEEKKIKPYANFKVCVSYTKQVMKYALLKGYIANNPYELLEMPVNEALKRKKEQKRRKKYYSIETVQESLELMKKEHGFQNYTLLALTYYLGATKGEIYPLVWADIDFQKQLISLSHKLVKNKETGIYERVEGMKNGYRFRDVPINDTIANLLKEWKQKQAIKLKQLGIKQTAHQFLFTYVNQKGDVNQPLHTDWLNNKLNQLEKKYGLPHIIPHGLRHTFVSDLLNQGIDGLIIKSLVGHAETSNMIRDVYGHTNEQTKIETIKRLEEYRQASQE
ncbi:site-specific integrase [Candidatus Enterococcus lemimoniae]|uniref:Tyr recombinase domain-containing protein n=1 Tax=Candidatus Enterococcus lemimoniae TaxID=1834167 RepID=A0ABZ2T7K1_9ENTE